MSQRDLSKLLRADMLSMDEDGKARLVGADIRDKTDDREIIAIEHETPIDKFLEEVIAPRVQMALEGRLVDKDGKPEPVWTIELVQYYQSLRNAARMMRPDVMIRIGIRRNYNRRK